MSHFVLGLGDLLNIHPLARLYWARIATVQETPARTVARNHSCTSDELAFYSLTAAQPARDPRAELGHFALLADVEGTHPGRVEDSWPILL